MPRREGPWYPGRAGGASNNRSLLQELIQEGEKRVSLRSPHRDPPESCLKRQVGGRGGGELLRPLTAEDRPSAFAVHHPSGPKGLRPRRGETRWMTADEGRFDRPGRVSLKMLIRGLSTKSTSAKVDDANGFMLFLGACGIEWKRLCEMRAYFFPGCGMLPTAQTQRFQRFQCQKLANHLRTALLSGSLPPLVGYSLSLSRYSLTPSSQSGDRGPVVHPRFTKVVSTFSFLGDQPNG